MKKYIFAAILFSTSMLSLSANAGNSNTTVGIGVEGFRDMYRESTTDTDVNSTYGSVTGYYSRQFGNSFFSLDARASYGSGDYESTSGTFFDAPRGEIDGVSQWELELRGRFGVTRPLWGGAFSPYVGIGTRYQRYEAKGYLTSLGDIAYDKRSMQVYIPIGASIAYTSGDWTITPQAEADIMVYGSVDSRLTTLWYHNYVTAPQFLDPSDNKQRLGLGGRGELMFGKAMDGYSLQAGPFVRYWYFGKSNKSTYQDISNPGTFYNVEEPENSYTQVGLKASVLW